VDDAVSSYEVPRGSNAKRNCRRADRPHVWSPVGRWGTGSKRGAASSALTPIPLATLGGDCPSSGPPAIIVTSPGLTTTSTSCGSESSPSSDYVMSPRSNGFGKIERRPPTPHHRRGDHSQRAQARSTTTVLRPHAPSRLFSLMNQMPRPVEPSRRNCGSMVGRDSDEALLRSFTRSSTSSRPQLRRG